MQKKKVFLIVFLLFLLSSLVVFSAELVGRVTDERGGGVSSALVLVSSNSSFSSRVFVFTGKGGFYHIKGLSPGWYYIRA
ncbi:MAG: carboxypeptidase regulatory-like domain-containing protein, partial [Acidobacteria bacterium]|nr:carboxypeptidase regulatory-like domain-containing protein [Acidobacteriota bacterium]